MNLKLTTTLCSAAAFAVVLLAGCGGNAPEGTAGGTATTTGDTAPTASAAPVHFNTGKPKGTVKHGDKLVCAVCSVKEGTREPEVVKATIDYKGKTYGFCSKEEEAEFISTPTKYADPS